MDSIIQEEIEANSSDGNTIREYLDKNE